MVKQSYNLAQVVSTAPMAMNEEFKTHDKTSYPFQPEKKKAKCVKVILNSSDRQSGSSLTSARFKVNLPQDFQSKKLNLVVDSFVESTAPNTTTNLPLYPYYIRIPEYKNHYSYSTNSGTTSSMILLTSGTSYFNNSPRDIGGSCVVDTSLFDRTITIEFYSPYFTISAANGIVNDWSLCLSLFDDVPDY